MIAVIGVGKIAVDQHLPVIDKSKDFEVAATVSGRGVQHRNLPVAAVMAGGYFPDLEHLTDLQLGVIKRLADYGRHYQEPLKTTLNR